MICQVGNFQFSNGIIIPELSTVIPKKELIQEIINQYSKHNNVMFTNNPLVLDCFDYDSVEIITESGERKYYIDHPQFEKWKDEFTVSEFYCVFGVNF